MDITGIIAIVSTLVIAPAIVFSFIYKVTKNKQEIKKLQYQKEILELEVMKQNNQIKLLEEENKKYDRIINNEP
jgi:Na+-translocating ferredoxin:NAD+ oxidoreductase RnfG subunit